MIYKLFIFLLLCLLFLALFFYTWGRHSNHISYFPFLFNENLIPLTSSHNKFSSLLKINQDKIKVFLVGSLALVVNCRAFVLSQTRVALYTLNVSSKNLKVFLTILLILKITLNLWAGHLCFFLTTLIIFALRSIEPASFIIANHSLVTSSLD